MGVVVFLVEREVCPQVAALSAASDSINLGSSPEPRLVTASPGLRLTPPRPVRAMAW